MKACRLSSKTFSFFIFSFFSNNILLLRHLPAINVLCYYRQFRRTISTRRGKTQGLRWCFTLNRNLFPLSFSFVRAPVKDSVRSTYSFVHMRVAMLAAVDHRDYTISSGAGGPYTKRSLCCRSMDHRVQELARSRTRFLLILVAARSSRWNRLVIETL